MSSKLAAFSTLGFTLGAPLVALAQAGAPQSPPSSFGPGPWHMWMWGGGYGWHAFWMFPLTILFFVLVFGALFSVARGPHGSRSWGAPGAPGGTDRAVGDAARSALQILNERFARGEIQKEEYTEKKAALLSRG